MHLVKTNLFPLQKCCSEQWPSMRHLCAISDKVETMPLVRLPLAVITIGALLMIAIFNLVSTCIFLYSMHFFPFLNFADLTTPLLSYLPCSWPCFLMFNSSLLAFNIELMYVEQSRMLRKDAQTICRTRNPYIISRSLCFRLSVYSIRWL